MRFQTEITQETKVYRQRSHLPSGSVRAPSHQKHSQTPRNDRYLTISIVSANVAGCNGPRLAWLHRTGASAFAASA